MLKLTNTLSGTKEEFKAIKPPHVGMYNCGPTVYDYPHIGNLRKYIFDDILRRTLKFNDYYIKQVINITDFGHLSSDADEGEDKMTKGLKREGKPMTMEAMKELGDFFTEKFIEDVKKLNIELPEVMPKASEHIKEDIDLISTLSIDKGYIYKTTDGLVF
jgi:cysteinyl-tRNA synthetase